MEITHLCAEEVTLPFKFKPPWIINLLQAFILLILSATQCAWKTIYQVEPNYFSCKGMEVVKVGGPVYRIGVGGGAASSIQVQGDNESELDFGAVQRGDAEMEQKLNRAIRACIEMGCNNPICSIHDQGAGGNGEIFMN